MGKMRRGDGEDEGGGWRRCGRGDGEDEGEEMGEMRERGRD